MIQRTLSYTKSFRKDVTRDIINPETIAVEHIKPERIPKSVALQKFIDNIPKLTADYADYVNFMFSFIFSQSDHSHTITREQKYYMKYLCSNERTYFSKNVTRGQIKLWTVIYYMKHNELPIDFQTLTDWIIEEKNAQGYPLQNETTSFLNDLNASKSYFDSIHSFNDCIILGNKDYQSSYFKKSGVYPTKIPKERYQGPNGHRNLMADNMFDPEKLAALKKKMGQINSQSLFNNEFILLRNLKTNPNNEFFISENTSKVFREILSLKHHIYVMNNNDSLNKTYHVNLMINFVVDTITSLYQQVLQFNKFEIDYCKDENEATLEIINKYLYVICSEQNIEQTRTLINICFKKEFLKINLNFEISYPKYHLFQSIDPNLIISKSENEELNEIIIAYADYISIDGSFMGYADLYILKSIYIFKDYNKDIERSLISQYSTENSHIGGQKIKSDGNCLLSTFIFEYLNKMKNLKLWSKILEEEY